MKKLKIDENAKAQALLEFQKKMEKATSINGVIDFKIPLGKPTVEHMPRVIFTPEAHTKMRGLVEMCSTEIGWHGVVKRHKNNVFLIEDILVYPQIVTGVTVDTDDTEYGKWIMEQPDNVFNKLRMQGHSHVNMGVTPSGTDINYYQNILSSLDGDDYYIFIILNKRHDMFINIYDFKANVLFETVDVKLEVAVNKTDSLKKWYSDNYEKYIDTPIRATATKYVATGAHTLTRLDARDAGLSELEAMAYANEDRYGNGMIYNHQTGKWRQR